MFVGVSLLLPELDVVNIMVLSTEYVKYSLDGASEIAPQALNVKRRDRRSSRQDKFVVIRTIQRIIAAHDFSVNIQPFR